MVREWKEPVDKSKLTSAQINSLNGIRRLYTSLLGVASPNEVKKKSIIVDIAKIFGHEIPSGPSFTLEFSKEITWTETGSAMQLFFDSEAPSKFIKNSHERVKELFLTDAIRRSDFPERT